MLEVLCSEREKSEVIERGDGGWGRRRAIANTRVFDIVLVIIVAVRNHGLLRQANILVVFMILPAQVAQELLQFAIKQSAEIMASARDKSISTG